MGTYVKKNGQLEEIAPVYTAGTGTGAGADRRCLRRPYMHLAPTAQSPGGAGAGGNSDISGAGGNGLLPSP